MSEPPSLTLLLAFTAGVLSFLSPCVLPLIPSYLTFITGLSLEDAQHARRTALIHAVLFTLGFSIIFVALGAATTALGQLLFVNRVWVARTGGALVLLLGIALAAGWTIPVLARERRVHLSEKPLGYLGTVVVGMAFGAGWTPCIGPILGSILAVAASTGSVSRGVGYLAMYSLGLALPFLVAAVALRPFIAAVSRARGWLVWTSRAAGVMLMVMGVLLLTDGLMAVATWLQGITPAALRSRL